MIAERLRIRLWVSGVLLLASVGMGVPAPAADTFKPFRLKTLEGATRSLADVQGKATLIVFFYPSCRYCNLAFPEIQKLHDAYKDRGLSVVCINVIPEEERLIPSWRAKHGYTVPILVGGRSLQNDYRLTMTPTHYLIDPGRRILWKHAGYKAGDEKAMERAIQNALGSAS